jgi:uncharacterized protein YaaW (UPF0174 family)
LHIYDEKGKKRLTTQILSDKRFIALRGSEEKWSKSWQLVVGELQHFGGDTIVNLVRRKGVPYRKILRDTCKRMEVKFEKQKKTWEIESKLIEHFTNNLWVKMSKAEKHEALKSMNQGNFNPEEFDWSDMPSSAFSTKASAVAWYAWAASAAKAAFAPAVFSRAAIAGASTLIAQRGATMFLGPAAAVALTIPAFSGTAFRVTVPATIQIAYMRKKYLDRDRFK